ncbi:hypothetical protein [Enterococcus sp. AZ180]|uniref:hypothetical protein n=1 Tax=Enterococcus sp. AZ180 TaxID=2774961 RepID=UPI003F22DCD3
MERFKVAEIFGKLRFASSLPIACTLESSGNTMTAFYNERIKIYISFQTIEHIVGTDCSDENKIKRVLTYLYAHELGHINLKVEYGHEGTYNHKIRNVAEDLQINESIGLPDWMHGLRAEDMALPKKLTWKEYYEILLDQSSSDMSDIAGIPEDEAREAIESEDESFSEEIAKALEKVLGESADLQCDGVHDRFQDQEITDEELAEQMKNYSNSMKKDMERLSEPSKDYKDNENFEMALDKLESEIKNSKRFIKMVSKEAFLKIKSLQKQEELTFHRLNNRKDDASIILPGSMPGIDVAGNEYTSLVFFDSSGSMFGLERQMQAMIELLKREKISIAYYGSYLGTVETYKDEFSGIECLGGNDLYLALKQFTEKYGRPLSVYLITDGGEFTIKKVAAEYPNLIVGEFSHNFKTMNIKTGKDYL